MAFDRSMADLLCHRNFLQLQGQYAECVNQQQQRFFFKQQQQQQIKPKPREFPSLLGNINNMHIQIKDNQPLKKTFHAKL